MRIVHVAASAALLGSPTISRAAEPGEPVRIEFRGEQGCPDKDAFMTSVRSRSARIREAEPGETARAFEVTLSRQANGRFHGELAVVDATAERARSIDGDSCEEVVDALALFTVLAVDPAAILGAPVEGTVVPAEPGAAKPQAPEPPPLAQPARRVDRPPIPPPRKPPPARPDERPIEYRAVVGLHGGVMAVGASAPLSAASMFAEFGLDDAGEVGLTFHPVARVSVLMTPETTITTPDGFARLRWTKLELDLCPLVVRGSRSLAFRPCFTVSEGLLDAAGEIAEPKSTTAPFRTLGALVRGEWAVLDNVLLELALGLEFPLRRDSFFFEPSTPIYEVPAVVGLVTLGGGFRFL